MVDDVMKTLRERMERDLATPRAPRPSRGRLDKFSAEQLLLELVRRLGTQEAPRQINLTEGDPRNLKSGHSIVTVGIGKDHHASIIVDDEALEELRTYEISRRAAERR
ncbi:MAG: hypothetical protein ACK5MY_02525 [Jhaorihella sp.]